MHRDLFSQLHDSSVTTYVYVGDHKQPWHPIDFVSVKGSVIVIRPGALGDTLLTLPLLTDLAAAGADITLVGTPEAMAVFACTAPLRCTDFGSQAWLGLTGGAFGPDAQTLLAARPTVISCLGSEPVRTQAAAALINSGARAVISRPAPRRGERAARADGFAHAAAKLAGRMVDGAAIVRTRTFLHPTPAERAAVKTLLTAVGVPSDVRPILLHPGSGATIKRWPHTRFAALAASLQAERLWPIFLRGPAEAAEAESAADAAQIPTLAPDLRGLAALCAYAAAFIGNDSGPTHLAAALCPTLALFGPTDPIIWAPLGSKVSVLAAAGGDLASLPVADVRHALASLTA